ncbi:MAG: hypothetical protein HFG77_07450 [Hungatella sp.]|nr:hypothetical protein [Dorea sp.]MCI9636217.1 hypothetical protein [Hungatella sp.]
MGIRTGHEKLGNQYLKLSVKGSTEIEMCTMVAVDGGGYAVPASKKAGLKIAGIALEYVDNLTGEDGGAKISVKRGTYLWNNDGTIKETDVLKECYICDARTVTVTSEGSSAAGVVLGLEGEYVVVDMMTQVKEVSA